MLDTYLQSFLHLENMIKITLVMLIGGFCAILANRHIAVAHDGLRALTFEHLEGRLTRQALFSKSMALSLGLMLGFGLPFSLITGIILVHLLLLGTDMIGLRCEKNKKGMILSGGLGGIYAFILLMLIQMRPDILSFIPLQTSALLMQEMHSLSSVIIIFPGLVIAYQHNYRLGVITLLLTLLLYAVMTHVPEFSLNILGTTPVIFDKISVPLLVSTTLLIALALKKPSIETNTPAKGPNEMLVSLFQSRIDRIKQHRWLLMISGGLIAMASTLAVGILAEGPASQTFMSIDMRLVALLIVLIRAISFIPLVGNTAVTSGVYGPDGMKFVFVMGLLVDEPWLAFIGGAALMYLETTYLAKLVIFLDKFPGVKLLADHIRTVMTRLVEFSFLIAAAIVGHYLLQAPGVIIVAILYLINKASKRPLIEMAIGPIAIILIALMTYLLPYASFFK